MGVEAGVDRDERAERLGHRAQRALLLAITVERSASLLAVFAAPEAGRTTK